MKYIGLLLLLVCPALWGQQPRLDQVGEYQKMTGKPHPVKMAAENRYNLLGTLYAKGRNILLNFPEMKDKGTKEILPFGFRLSERTEVKTIHHSGSLCESVSCGLWNESVFSDVSYLLCDSVVYGVRMKYADTEQTVRGFIQKELKTFFSEADYVSDSLSVYSDADYLVKVTPDQVMAYSLFHYPAVETRFPGVTHYYWEAPCEMILTDGTRISISFYNQLTKENNWQTAFRLYVRSRGDEPFEPERIRFEVDGISYTYPLASFFTERTPCGWVEKVMRVFVAPEVLKRLSRTNGLTVTLEGRTRKFDFVMPAYQRASLSTAYEYFRWNVTNALVKYKGW